MQLHFADRMQKCFSLERLLHDNTRSMKISSESGIMCYTRARVYIINRGFSHCSGECFATDKSRWRKAKPNFSSVTIIVVHEETHCEQVEPLWEIATGNTNALSSNRTYVECSNAVVISYKVRIARKREIVITIVMLISSFKKLMHISYCMYILYT